MRITYQNFDGCGSKRTHTYDLPVISNDFWTNVTDIPCPLNSCDGVIRCAEAGYVPGYRICDKCKRHFLAKQDKNPILYRVGNRRS